MFNITEEEFTILSNARSAQRVDQHIFVHQIKCQNLLTAGLVRINIDAYNAAGEIGCKITDAGIAYLNTITPPVSVNTTFTYKVETGIAPPPPRSRQKARSLWPFEIMNIGDFFFIENTTEVPRASRAYASTVAAVNKKWALIDPQRKFIMREITRDDGRIGVGVWRVDPEDYK